MNIKIIIPARYQSSRFPGKPLIDLNGKSMIERVWRNCCDAIDSKDIYIATESYLIHEHCWERGIQCLLTSDNCKTGTDRVYEASQRLDNIDVIINVQGDLPLLSGKSVKKVIKSVCQDPEIIHYGMNEILKEEDFRSFSIVKVVTDLNKRLLYASRSPIPVTKENNFVRASKTASIFAVPIDTLKAFAQLKFKTPLESIEDVEILRFIELGYNVQMVKLKDISVSVDYPEDADKVRRILSEKNS